MRKFKKKNSTSDRRVGRPLGRGHGKRVPGTQIAIAGTAHGEDPKLVVHPPECPDPEKLLCVPNDDLSRHKYPPPKRNPTFRKVWGQFIDSISRRDNFNVGHLNALEVLCDLFAEYEDLHVFIRTKGRSYQTFGRSGMTWKLYPEVGHLKSVQHQINVYMKQLGLTLRRDDSGLSGGEAGEWA